MTLHLTENNMHAIKATYRNGHLELSEPVNWPDGMQVNVVPLTNDSNNKAVSSAMMHQWPVGFLNQIRDLWGDAPLERPPQGEFEQRENW